MTALPPIEGLVRPRSDCPNADAHTPTPLNYVEFSEWAEKASKTHRSRKCPDCLRWAIWEPKAPRHGRRPDDG